MILIYGNNQEITSKELLLFANKAVELFLAPFEVLLQVGVAFRGLLLLVQLVHP